MNIPNAITLIRILLTPFFFTALVSYDTGKEYYRWIALGIFMFCSLTDMLDGFVARFWKQQTELGRFLDPLADKILLLSGYLGLLFIQRLPYHPPLWITVTIVFRDMVIIFGMAILFLVYGKLRVQPNYLGKLTTAAQMITLAFVLLGWEIAIIFCYITGLLTILSCMVYVVREMKLIKYEKTTIEIKR